MYFLFNLSEYWLLTGQFCKVCKLDAALPFVVLWTKKTNVVPSAPFHYKKKAEKRAWNTSNTWLKFAQIEGIFFRINFGIRGRRCWKYQQEPRTKTTQKDMSRKRYKHLYPSRCLVLVCIHCESKVEKLWKVDHWTPILWWARSRSNKQKETEIWIKKDGSKSGSNSHKIRLKI